MTFQDFLEAGEARMRHEVGDLDGGDSVYMSLAKSHVFNMGEDEVIESNVASVWEDLKGDMARGIPLPFSDITCVSKVKDRELGVSGYIMDRLIEAEITDFERAILTKEFQERGALSQEAQAALRRGPIQKICVMRTEEFQKTVASWIIFYYGAVQDGLLIFPAPSALVTKKYGIGAFDDDMIKTLVMESLAIIKQAAMISHPTNYLVEVRPELTPREARRAAAGKGVSVKKTPHYVVLDYDGLQELRGVPLGGTHASPVPHHRRGHWMRLSERCRNARALGLDKTWVRPSFIGDREFSDVKNKYIVHLDMNRGVAV